MVGREVVGRELSDWKRSDEGSLSLTSGFLQPGFALAHASPFRGFSMSLPCVSPRGSDRLSRKSRRHSGRGWAGWLWLWVVLCPALVWGADGQSDKEKSLLAVLRSDAPAAEKAITCKQLAVHGSADCVPDLAPLLANPQLASWARIALEAIPGPEASAALREAAAKLDGGLLVGVVNSLGVRRDVGAVELLTQTLSHADAEVASAAAVALGRIPNAGATQALTAALEKAAGGVRNAVAEGCILAAERLAASDRPAALALYTQVRKADVPAQRQLEATRGAILTAPAGEGLALLREQLHSPEKSNHRLGLTVVREFPGDTIDAALLDDVAKLPAERAGLLVEALADRRDTVRLPGLLSLANTGAKPVKLAAIRAVGRVGNDTCLTSLLGVVATETDPELRQAAEAALAELPGDGVNAAVVAQLAKGDEVLKPVLLGVIARRRIPAVDEVLKSLKGAKPAVRQAGLAALGATVELDRLPVLIDEVVQTKGGDESAVTALKTASVRMPDREGCAGLLAGALPKASPEAKGTLIETLAAVGGTKALGTLAGAARGSDPLLQDLSTRHLGEWMTADAAPVLLDLTKSAPGEKFQVRALRGYIRIARQFVLPEPERLQMCEQALAAAKQPAEQKMVLDVLKRYPSLGGLKLALATGRGAGEKNAALRDEAQSAALAITAKLGAQAPEAKKLLEQLDLAKVKLEILKATYGAGGNVRDVTEIVRKSAGGLPLITLPQENYNAAFGGDPAPGVMKQLKVQYKLNDKAGEASFAENALIILPTPK